MSLCAKKRIRGVIKRLVPYAMQRAYAFRTYGIYFPNCVTRSGWVGWLQGLFWSCLPFGLVCVWKRMDADVGCGATIDGSDSFLSRLLEPRYRLSRARLRQLRKDQSQGLSEFSDIISRNRSARILVVLHLYYERAWPVIREYLKNLAPYTYDLTVTYPSGRCSESTLDAIRTFRGDVKLMECANRGFDVWPFVWIVNETDLDSYDIVFKVHSKGIGRPSIFIYDQVFKRDDWFFNLFDGILGGKTVHQAIDALMNRKAKLVAAENLIVSDPVHKRHFTREFCQARGLDSCENYRFVAGTCFAVRTEILRPVKALKLEADDFAPTSRGTFSTAHAVERWMCFAAKGAITGLTVAHQDYPRERKFYAATSAMRLLDDPRFILDDEFSYRVLENRSVMLTGYDVCRIRLGDIRRMRHDGSICRLEECEPYLYLKGDVRAYDEYCQANRCRSGFVMSRERFDKLLLSMSDYDPRRMPVVRGEHNIILDGQHRCCVLLNRFGPDHEIEAVKIW